MSVEGEKGLKDLLGMIKNLKGSTISGFLDKMNLSAQDKQNILVMLEQINGQGSSGDIPSKANALELLQRILQQAKNEGQQAKLEKLLDKINQTKLSEDDQKIVEEIKKLSK